MSLLCLCEGTVPTPRVPVTNTRTVSVENPQQCKFFLDDIAAGVTLTGHIGLILSESKLGSRKAVCDLLEYASHNSYPGTIVVLVPEVTNATLLYYLERGASICFQELTDMKQIQSIIERGRAFHHSQSTIEASRSGVTLEIRLHEREVRTNGELVHLTGTLWQILHILVRKKNQKVPIDHIIEILDYGDFNSVSTAIYRLRKALGPARIFIVSSSRGERAGYYSLVTK